MQDSVLQYKQKHLLKLNGLILLRFLFSCRNVYVFWVRFFMPTGFIGYYERCTASQCLQVTLATRALRVQSAQSSCATTWTHESGIHNRTSKHCILRPPAVNHSPRFTFWYCVQVSECGEHCTDMETSFDGNENCVTFLSTLTSSSRSALTSLLYPFRWPHV